MAGLRPARYFLYLYYSNAMILYRYIIRRHLAPLLYSLGILVFLFVTQYAIQILDQILSRGLDVGIVLEIFLINLGWIIALAIPGAILCATLMAFGSMSADNEIVAIKAAGVNMYSLLTPVIAASVVVCVINIYFNDLILPDANHRVANLMSDIARKRPAALIEPNVLIRDFEHYTMHVSEVNAREGKIKSVKIFSDVPGEDFLSTIADSGLVRQTPSGDYIELTLYHGETHSIPRQTPKQYFVARFEEQKVLIPNVDSELKRTSSSYRGDREQGVAMMNKAVASFTATKNSYLTDYNTTLDTLWATIHAYATYPDTPLSKTSRDSLFTACTTFAMLRDKAPSRGAAQSAISNTISFTQHIMQRVRDQEMSIAQYTVEIYKKYAMPVACIVFILVGAPLGIMAKRGGIGIGASYSIFFFIVYWACLIEGEFLADRLIIAPFWAMWSANIIIGLCGIFLIFRMVRESPFSPLDALGKLASSLKARFSKRVPKEGTAVGAPSILSIPFWIAKKASGTLQAYVMRIFLGYFLGVLSSLLVVFVVIDYVSNAGRFSDASIADSALFYWYYLPWIIQMVTPIVLLLSTMFTLGKLAAKSELIAMKAAGRSLRRVTLPLLIFGALFSLGMFYFGERVLPVANQLRSELTDHMREKRASASGTYRPPRDYYRGLYYFANTHTLYRFEDFRTSPTLATNLWRERFMEGAIIERITAAEATYENKSWILHNVTKRSFYGDSTVVSRFSTLVDTILKVSPSTMVTRSKKIEEMSYQELETHIENSARRGEKVTSFLADLHYKVAYPFMNFIVILLGIAISARTGRSGSAVLLGSGILICFAYWILSQTAITFGKDGRLSPLFAAWLGNILFLSIGLFLYGKADK